MRRRALLAGLSAAPAAARAQGWVPERPVRMLIGFAAGGSTDAVGRQLAQALAERLGQPVVVENRTGAGGNIASEAAARAAPDGHTVLFGSSGMLVANPALYRKLGFDTLRDFAPVARVSLVPNVIVVRPELPVRDLPSLIAYAKARPGELFYGSAGAGSSLHLGAVLLCTRAGIEMVHVPYRSGAQAVTDLVADKIQLIAAPQNEVLGFLQAGTLRAIAVTTPERSAQLPDVPTAAETLPGLAIQLWNGVVAPAGTPQPAITRLATEIVSLLRQPVLRDRLASQGTQAAPLMPEEFAAFIRAELPRWAEIVRISGATAD